MTYDNLAKKIHNMSDENRRSTVTVYLRYADEYIEVESLEESSTDVLDKNHPILTIID